MAVYGFRDISETRLSVEKSTRSLVVEMPCATAAAQRHYIAHTAQLHPT
jgi:hypothetical protein